MTLRAISFSEILPEAQYYGRVATYMNMPELRHFLGWDKPAPELLARKLEELNATHPSAFRRATVVVPTAESGRRLREYMAERAGKPILMPKITLAGQLIPCNAENVATEQETLAAWLHVLSRAMADKPLPWLLEVATQMQRVRKQLEQEGRAPDWQEDTAQQFVRDFLREPETQWENTICYEKERWEALRTAFSEVDEQLKLWNKRPPEQCRAQELHTPGPRGLIILAFVPELSPLNRLYLQRLTERGAAQVEIWVNAPPSEAGRFDTFGQPIPVIESGSFAHQGWSECAIEIPPMGPGQCLRAEDVIHPTGSVQEFGQKVRELAGGHHANELILASCDDSLSPMLVSAFRPDWQINLPEGRSLLATEAGQLPRQLKNACAILLNEEQTERSGMEDFLTLLRNRTLQCCFSEVRVPASFNRYLTELCNQYLPGSIRHLQHIMQRSLQEEATQNEPNEYKIRRIHEYIRYTETVAQLIEDCTSTETLPLRLRELAAGLTRYLSSPEMKRAARVLTDLMRDTAALVANRLINCPPQAALMLMTHMLDKQAGGVLEGAGERNKSINLKGWRELCYTCEPKIIIAGMHDGHVPERMPADAYLPNAYRTFMSMTNDTTRCARDSFLLTALLHSRPAGAIHFVLSACTTDGTPIAPSSLLLRCHDAAETAERVHWLFSDPQGVPQNQAYDLLPFLTPPPHPRETDAFEDIGFIAPGVNNPYADTHRTFSPSAIKSFLSCPLRFWLNKLLGVAPGDALQEDKSEPDFAEYGTLLHAILQDITTRYASAPAESDANTLTDEISRYAEECTIARVAEQYGDESSPLPIPIRILQRNLCKTTREFAKWHANDLLQGWEVIMMEEQLVFSMPSGNDSDPLLFDMRVDRVDRHRTTGKMRVIDYKSNASDPRKTHWEKLPDTATALYHAFMPEAFILTDSKENIYRWSSVQLPLYAEALRSTHHLSEIPETAFYNLPRTTPGIVSYTPMCGPEPKAPMTEELHCQAMQCVQMAANLMRSGRCLYSAESLGRALPYDNFGALSIYKDPDPRVMCSLPPLNFPISNN